MKVGDHVEWTSQANGSKKVKRGLIVAVVPPGVLCKSLTTLLIKQEKFSFLDGHYDYSAIDQRHYNSRTQESYLVVVAAPVGSRRRPKLYWPIASLLSVVG